MILKYAFRNIVRLPKQAIIYAVIAILVTASLITGAFVYSAAENAIKQLNDEYVFVATLVPVSSLNSKGTSDITSYLTYSQFEKCWCEDICRAYNLSFPRGDMYLSGDDFLFSLPTEEPVDDPSKIFVINSDYEVSATANLYLERVFFGKGGRITEGRAFSDDAYLDNTREIIIPKSVAEKKNIKVGDTVTVCVEADFNSGYKYTYSQYDVVGIYEADGGAYTPSYITAMNYIRNQIRTNRYSCGNIKLYRADFVLNDYNDFEKLVEYANENEVDFSKYQLKFNNALYDRILSGLENVRNVVILVVFVISLIGIGMFAFFTLFFTNGRKREWETLHLLGMRRLSIFACFAAEMLVILLVSLPIGAVLGSVVSDSIFGYVNGNTLSGDITAVSAAESYSEENYSSLERRTEISVSKYQPVKAEAPELFETAPQKEGYGRYLLLKNSLAVRLYVKGAIRKTDLTEIKILAVEDLGISTFFDLSEPYPQAEPQKSLRYVYAYVPENYSGSNDVGLDYDFRRVVWTIFRGDTPVLKFNENNAYAMVKLIIVGTYKANEMCDDHTVLVDYADALDVISGFTGYADGYIETGGNGN